VAEGYSLSVSWGDIVFERVVKDGSHEYVSEMSAAGHLTTDVFRSAVDRSDDRCHLTLSVVCFHCQVTELMTNLMHAMFGTSL